MYSRLSQGDKVARQVSDIHKEHNEGLTLIQQTLNDHKRKQTQAMDTVRVCWSHEKFKFYVDKHKP